jgi:hypothetical protein
MRKSTILDGNRVTATEQILGIGASSMAHAGSWPTQSGVCSQSFRFAYHHYSCGCVYRTSYTALKWGQMRRRGSPSPRTYGETQRSGVFDRCQIDRYHPDADCKLPTPSSSIAYVVSSSVVTGSVRILKTTSNDGYVPRQSPGWGPQSD